MGSLVLLRLVYLHQLVVSSLNRLYTSCSCTNDDSQQNTGMAPSLPGLCSGDIDSDTHVASMIKARRLSAKDDWGSRRHTNQLPVLSEPGMLITMT